MGAIANTCPPCCTTTPSICGTYCSDPGPGATSLTFSGFADSHCTHCADYNSTFIIPSYTAAIGKCVKQIDSTTGALPGTCKDTAQESVINASFDDFGGGHTRLRILLTMSHLGANESNYDFNYDLGVSPVACNGISVTISTPTQTNAGLAQCDGSGASVLVVN